MFSSDLKPVSLVNQIKSLSKAELAATNKLPSQRRDDLVVTRVELLRHNERPKHLNEEIHLRVLKSSESFIPTRVPALVSFTSTQHTAVTTPSRHNNPCLLCSCVKMVGPLSLGDVIITAASLKPLSFLPGDPGRLPYPEAGRANISPPLWETLARTGLIHKTTTAKEFSWANFFLSIKAATSYLIKKRGGAERWTLFAPFAPDRGEKVDSAFTVVTVLGRKKWIYLTVCNNLSSASESLWVKSAAPLHFFHACFPKHG